MTTLTTMLRSALVFCFFGVCLGQCGAPDGFWDEYRADGKDVKQQQKQVSHNHDHHHHDHDHHHHDHDHHHHDHDHLHQQKKKTDQKPEKKGRAQVQEDYDEILARIEREAHGRVRDNEPEEQSLFGANFLLYGSSAVFGVLVLLPFWMPFLLPLLVRRGVEEGAAKKEESTNKEGTFSRSGIVDGWFVEVSEQWPGQSFSLKVDKVLLDTKTKFQHLVVFKSETYGNVMALDGALQITEKDEMAYQELLAHLPLFAHANPTRVLIVGGGDGGVLREVLKHKTVKAVDMCEIDGDVVEASKKFFPNQSTGFSDPRLNLVIDDAIEFCKTKAEKSKEVYDVVIVDSSDPLGPAEGLFTAAFYANVHTLLKPDGVLAVQGESMWLHRDLIQRLHETFQKQFTHSTYASIQIPSYPAGQIGAFVVSKAEKSPKSPVRKVPNGMKLCVYTSELHEAVFVLPRFVNDVFAPATQTKSE